MFPEYDNPFLFHTLTTTPGSPEFEVFRICLAGGGGAGEFSREK